VVWNADRVGVLDCQDLAHDVVLDRIRSGADPAEAVARVVAGSGWARSLSLHRAAIVNDSAGRQLVAVASARAAKEDQP